MNSATCSMHECSNYVLYNATCSLHTGLFLLLFLLLLFMASSTVNRWLRLKALKIFCEKKKKCILSLIFYVSFGFYKENPHGLSSCCYACLLAYGSINIWICKYVTLSLEIWVDLLMIHSFDACLTRKMKVFFFFFDYLIGVTRKQGFWLTNNLYLFILLRL